MAERTPPGDRGDNDVSNDRPVTFLHIGSPKSGTTYLQSLLWENRHSLQDAGVLYPGERYLSHTHAALDLQGQLFAGYADPAVSGAWQRLVDAIRAWNGVAIVSQELFSPARPDHIERAMDSLEFSEVHLIYTARDLVRQVPAAWQEDIKNRHTLKFAEFVSALQAPEDEWHPLASGFWRMQDAADVLSRWSAHIPPERVHLLTIPQSDAPPRLLWETFCDVVGIAADKYPTDEAVANSSIGIEEAHLLRRLNLTLKNEVRWPVYGRCVTGLLGTEILAARPDRRRIILSGPDRDWIAERAREMVDRLRECDYDVVGDLDDLVPPSMSETEAVPDPDVPAGDAMLDAAVESMAALLGRLQRWRDEIDRLDARNAVLRAELDAASGERDRLRAEVEEQREILRKPATKLFIRRLSEKNRAVMRVRIIYWNVVEGLRSLRGRLSPR